MGRIPQLTRACFHGPHKMEATAEQQRAQATGRAANGTTLSLRWRIVLILLFVSLLPLAVVGLGSGVVFGNMLEDKSLQLQRATVRSHAIGIDAYLVERLRALELVARTNTLEQLSDQERLRELFDQLRDEYDDAFLDLGVIDATGAHKAYVGPYDLAGKNYATAGWFREVTAHGSYVSDVFLGYRNTPHFVIAVQRRHGDTPWILRATINSRQFEALVGGRQLGAGEQVFLVNREGRYQTPPRIGHVLDAAPVGVPEPHQGLLDTGVSVDGKRMVQVTTWLNQGRWMLVVLQDEAAVRAPVNRAMGMGGLVTAVAVLLLVVTMVLATRHLTRQIDRANERRDQLSRELLRSAKLASVGELATGLAHEINNPLAIISSERTNLSDVVGSSSASAQDRKDLQDSIDRIRRQVERCSSITAKMLQFGRKNESQPRLSDIGPPIHEVAQLLHKQAEVRNVNLEVKLEPELPGVFADLTELEQVLVNLINNSLHAMKQGGTIRIGARVKGQAVELSVGDDGAGIAKGDLDRIFQPFFTTKPVGEGTGLGLSVCYGIVRGWGATIAADSEVGRGTTMTIRLPIPATGGAEQVEQAR